MVSLAIGLIVSLAVMMGYLGAAQAQRGQTDLGRVQESARFAFDLFGREARHVAFRDNTVPRASGNLVWGNLTASNTYLAGSNDATSVTPSGGTATSVYNNGDVIVFRYYGKDNFAGTAADGTILNCSGTAVRASDMNEDTLYLARDTTNTTNDSSGEPTLFCVSRLVSGGTSTTSSPVAVIAGVDSMQILYGEDTDATADGIINHYVPASSLTNTDFSRVIAVMVSVAIRSPQASGFTAGLTLNHFGTDYAPGPAGPTTDPGAIYTAASDGRIRRIYNSTFALQTG
jgi:type IV pilus assembly protein PilW